MNKSDFRSKVLLDNRRSCFSNSRYYIWIYRRDLLLTGFGVVAPLQYRIGHRGHQLSSSYPLPQQTHAQPPILWNVSSNDATHKKWHSTVLQTKENWHFSRPNIRNRTTQIGECERVFLFITLFRQRLNKRVNLGSTKLSLNWPLKTYRRKPR